jgi:hypothetical protein
MRLNGAADLVCLLFRKNTVPHYSKNRVINAHKYAGFLVLNIDKKAPKHKVQSLFI